MYNFYEQSLREKLFPAANRFYREGARTDSFVESRSTENCSRPGLWIIQKKNKDTVSGRTYRCSSNYQCFEHNTQSLTIFHGIGLEGKRMI